MRYTFLCVLFLLWGHTHAICCSCMHKGQITVEDFNSYDWIFTGTLIGQAEVPSDDKSYYQRRKATYKVIQVYKGTAKVDTVHVYDAIDLGACGLGKLTIGHAYLIYAVGNEMKWTTSCYRTTPVPLHTDSAAIEKLLSLKSFGEFYDTTHSNFYADMSFLKTHRLLTKISTTQKFYNKKGEVSAEGKYTDGVQDGFWNYYENGKIVSKGKYIMGKKDSLWVEPYMDQSVYIREYKNGEFTYREKFFFDGKLAGKKEPLANSDKWVEYDYHSNGKERYISYANAPRRNERGELEDIVSDGSFKMFNRAGVVLQEGIHKNGFTVGRWKYYYEDGKLRMEGSYIEGEKMGIWKIYYPDKKIKATGEYRNDKKIGKWRYYNESGKGIPANPKLIEKDEDWFTYSAA